MQTLVLLNFYHSFWIHYRLTNHSSASTNRSKIWRAHMNELSVLNLFIFLVSDNFCFGERKWVLDESLLFEAVVAQWPLLSVPCTDELWNFGLAIRSFIKRCVWIGRSDSWFGSSLLIIRPLFTCIVLNVSSDYPSLAMKKNWTSAFWL